MPAFTVTITDKTQPAQNIWTLSTKGSQPGYTVNPPSPQPIKAVTEIQDISYLSIQASNSNGAAVVYKGDQGVANNGTRQAKELLAGQSDVMMMYPRVVYLEEVYIQTNTNGSIVNVEYHHS